MWCGVDDEGDGDASDEISSSFASSRSVSRDSEAETTRRLRPEHTTAIQAEDGEDDSEDDGYDDEDFERYSDEFESDDEDDDDGDSDDDDGEDDESGGAAWRAGDRVQVYWEDECLWFDGVVECVETSRCFVHYTDGEQQWETHGIIRTAPPAHVADAATATQQLQQLHHADDPQTTTTLIGRRVVVYWWDESDWFDGRIDKVDQVAGTDRIHVVYDDGDDQWLSHAAFRDVLVLPLAASVIISTDTRATESVADRTLTPRPYTAALEHHFEPIRVARPYKCTVATTGHIGSVLTPRSWSNTPRPYYQPRVVAQLDCDSRAHRLPSSSSNHTTAFDCQVQTEISLAAAEACSSSSSSLSLSSSSCPVSA